MQFYLSSRTNEKILSLIVYFVSFVALALTKMNGSLILVFPLVILLLSIKDYFLERNKRILKNVYQLAIVSVISTIILFILFFSMVQINKNLFHYPYITSSNKINLISAKYLSGTFDYRTFISNRQVDEYLKKKYLCGFYFHGYHLRDLILVDEKVKSEKKVDGVFLWNIVDLYIDDMQKKDEVYSSKYLSASSFVRSFFDTIFPFSNFTYGGESLRNIMSFDHGMENFNSRYKELATSNIYSSKIVRIQKIIFESYSYNLGVVLICYLVFLLLFGDLFIINLFNQYSIFEFRKLTASTICSDI